MLAKVFEFVKLTFIEELAIVDVGFVVWIVANSHSEYSISHLSSQFS